MNAAASLSVIPAPETLGRLAIGGAAGTAAWEFTARVIGPITIGETPSPQDLIGALAGTLFGLELPGMVTLLVHLATGIVAYPILYLLIRAMAPGAGALGAGAVVGVATWVLALGIFAPIVGAPFLLDLAPLSWLSLVGHLAYGVALALVAGRIGERG
ncbi:MAG: hypothetical protein IT557_12325 [Alphaproteobacteria bacterium]|nr:hypothetical protein [Alphaproteobacteria bacterium]